MIRNGLMVVAFAALEDFLQLRTAELLDHISGAPGVRFATLPPRLQDATTEDVAAALSALLRHWRATDSTSVRPHIQRVGRALASTGGSPLFLSADGFRLGRSNLAAGDVKRWLGIFGVQDGWRNLDRIAARIGLTNPSLESGFASGLSRRNAAAHDPRAGIQVGDLQSFHRDALAIGIGFDALATRAARLVATRRDQPIHRGRLIDSDVSFRFLDPIGTAWRETAEGRRATYIGASLASLRGACSGRARRRHEVVVIRSPNTTRVDWQTSDLP